MYRYSCTFFLPLFVSSFVFQCSNSSSVAPEPRGSSPHSQESATGPYPEPTESTPHLPAILPKTHSDPDPPIYASVFRVVSFLRAFPLKPCTIPSPLPSWHMPQSSHYPWFNLPNYIWGWVQIMSLLTVQLPPFSCYFIPLWSKYSP
jgi:hypothetical protein